MQMIKVESSFIDEIGYDVNKQQLVIHIRNDRYIYSYVKQQIFDQFLIADSKGQFFHQFIKDQYRFVKESL